MPDKLKHWDAADQLSGKDAACLVVGIDPNDPQVELHRHLSLPTLARMVNSYEWMKHVILGERRYVPLLENAYLNAPLQSCRLTHLLRKAVEEDQEIDLIDWLCDAEKSAFDTQVFDRGQLSQWLIDADIESRYEFAREGDRAGNQLQEEEPEPVTANGDSADSPPRPLTTTDIAFCFAGLRWGEQGWKKPLGDKPKWLAACIVIPGQRGVSETRWNPVLVGAALVRAGHVQPNSIRARFQTKPLLMPWLDAWKTYEGDSLDID